MADITITIREKTMEELKRLKNYYQSPSIDDLLNQLINEGKKRLFDEFSEDFKKRLEEKGLSLEDFIESGLQIREEILKDKGIIE